MNSKPEAGDLGDTT